MKRPSRPQYMVAGIVAVCVVALVAAMVSTYVPFQSLRLDAAKIELTQIPSGATVFIDSHAVSVTGTSLSQGVSPGTHTVLVGLTGHWPWTKQVTLSAHDSISLAAFLLPQQPHVTALVPTDAKYNQAMRAVSAAATTTSKTSPVISHDGNVGLWIEKNVVYASWRGKPPVPSQFCAAASGSCDTPERLLAPAGKTVTQAQFLGSRDDVALVALPDGIYGIETDTRGTQNFEPLYTTTNPHFVVIDAHTLYVLSNGKLLEITF